MDENFVALMPEKHGPSDMWWLHNALPNAAPEPRGE
jgi:hypothetical protein